MGGVCCDLLFEATWYSGSIYGGVDAAHRYNRERLDGALDDIGGEAAFAPVCDQYPLVSLRFSF